MTRDQAARLLLDVLEDHSWVEVSPFLDAHTHGLQKFSKACEALEVLAPEVMAEIRAEREAEDLTTT